MIRAALIFLALTGAAKAACRDEIWKDVSYTVCEISADADLRLFLDDAAGAKYASFDRLNDALGGKLTFAMNAGMYHPDRRPVGLYVEDGAEQTRIITADTSGNFGLLPNGVFCILPGRVDVIESRSYKDAPPGCTYASQSGPMLVIGGKLHPKFLKGSSYTNIRNGVGVSPDGSKAYFVISNAPVNFYDFASYFRERLAVLNALYFDGRISRLYAPDLGREDRGLAMGPIVGVVGE